MKGRKSKTPGHAINADTAALRVMASTGFSHVLLTPRDGLMILKPIRVFPMAGGLVGAVFVIVGGVLYFKNGNPAGLFLGGVGGLFAAAFALIALSMRRFEFDRDAGSLVTRRCGSTRRWELEQVRAFQLIEGGWHGRRQKFFTYQLNVVLDDPVEPRMNLTNAANWDATWTTGSELAEFLGVPLLDAVSAG
jgi:hypothetical protein